MGECRHEWVRLIGKVGNKIKTLPLYACKKCGMIAIFNKFKNKGLCPVCGEGSDITLIEMSYAFKLLLDELKSLVIYPKLHIEPKS